MRLRLDFPLNIVENIKRETRQSVWRKTILYLTSVRDKYEKRKLPAKHAEDAKKKEKNGYFRG